MIFVMALTTVYSWQTMLAEYSEVGIQQLNLDNLRVAESLDVSVLNSNNILLTNPTAQTVRVVNVLSDNVLVWNGSLDVAPFSSTTLYHSVAGGEAYRVITMRGNVFSAGLEDRRADVAQQGWHVKFVYNDTYEPGTNPLNPLAHPEDEWGASTIVGETYWYNTNINWEWNYTAQPFGNLSLPAGTCTGFIASTTLVKVVNESYNATINFYIDTGDSSFDRSRVALAIDGVLQRPLAAVVWYDSSHYVWFTLTGPQYSVHEVSVYFYGRDVEVQKLSLNVVNATVAS